MMKHFFKYIIGEKNIYRILTVRHILYLLLMYPVVVLFPRDNKKILFGAWYGNQFSDNPKYFLKYILSLNKGFKCYWIGNKSIQSKVEAFEGVQFVLKGSTAAKWHLLTARWLVSNLGAECDVTGKFPTYGRIKQLSFWHGAAFKGVCHRDYHAELSSNPFKRFAQYFLSRDFNIATPLYSWASFSFEEMRFLMPFEVPWQFKPEMSIAAGTARVDYLINNANNQKEIIRVKNNIAWTIGLPIDKKWYLYMPTYRKGKEIVFSFLSSAQISMINSILESKNAILIEKQHPLVLLKSNIKEWQNGNIYMLPSDKATFDIDTQELLLSSDLLITDYSSCCCDFATMNRPVIHYVCDYNEYTSTERKEAHDINEYALGYVAFNEDELIKALSFDDKDLLGFKGCKGNELIEGEKGNACETFAKWVGLIN